ncbi:MAG: tRNA (N(6)-L-threonylcarbamoyladenosine(37)-C(2))-methylthiotransferase MtaB [bacterium]|nr:tRNA (N(6)-L-threonylcarbamoyladenosine(37)-C(2))-methylthiotransferase MtaB [bacterium]
MPKFSITTLGCKVNQAESEAIAEDLLASDWSAVDRCDGAGVCIVNTCTVTQKASMQSRQAIRQAIRANPKARIVVTGCYAQTAPREIDKIDGVDYIVGHDKKMSISQLILPEGNQSSTDQSPSAGDVHNESRFRATWAATSTSRTRPFLKIQDGCNAFCTYCIVPYARGRSRSMPLDNVLQNIGQLNRANFHEVVLTGIHLGAYGRDLTPAANLATLLDRIQAQKPIGRVRLSSIEPLELTREIIQIVADSDTFCHHFHVPLQSGDDRILKKMGRPYSRQSFRDLVRIIHEMMPDTAMGVDTLVGFPGENDRAFENTYRLIESLPVSYLHVFPFSVRPGTPAAEFADPVPYDIIKDRCERMRMLGQDKRMNFYRRFPGQTMPVLVESKRDKATGLLKGISSNYLPVLIDGPDTLKNKIIDVKIEKLEGDKLFGMLCN